MSNKADNKIYVIGLTGQSGSGKTLVSDYLVQHGYAVINADIVARSVTADGSECNRRLRELFPSCVSENFGLDRRKLGDVVFNDKEKLKLLNDTIFPYINKNIEHEISQYEKQGSRVVVLDAPTLFEAGADKLCNMIISVVSDDNIRAQRIRKRDGITDEQIRARFSSQKSADFYIRHSDAVIENNDTPDILIEKAKDIFDAIKENNDG